MLASAVAIGVLSGLALGGRLDRLREFSIGWLPLLGGAVALRLLAPLAGDFAVAAYVLGFSGVAAVALRNRSRPGMMLIVAGASLNLMVVTLNGGMPVSEDAIQAAAATMPTDRLHFASTAGASLFVLADVLPIAPLRAVYSVGDVAIALGGAAAAFRAVNP